MAILGRLIQTQIGERGVELHVPRKELMRRSHQRVADVVAGAAQGTEAYQLSATDLRLVATDSLEVGMALRKSHFRPGIQRRPGLAVAACNVGLVGLVVVEEIELDEFDTWQHQRPNNSANPTTVPP